MSLIKVTPARVYNLSILVGLLTLGAGVAQACGRPVALIVFGSLVIALAVFERVLPLISGGR